MIERVMDRLISLRDWADERFPIMAFWQEHLSKYYAPKNLNFWYYFGSLAVLVLVLQLLTGIFLTMNYKPTAGTAFASVEYIMRDVNWGWLIRYMHSTGASFFFVVVYLHMFRALLYGSYRGPRELLWLFGMLIFVLLMAEAFICCPGGRCPFGGRRSSSPCSVPYPMSGTNWRCGFAAISSSLTPPSTVFLPSTSSPFPCC